MSVYPCCECCLTDTPHPYGHETSCKKCNNLTADRLRAEVERLTAQIEAVRALHVACESPIYCIGCSEAAYILDTAEELDGDAPLYPCPTIRALDGVA